MMRKLEISFKELSKDVKDLTDDELIYLVKEAVDYAGIDYLDIKVVS